MNLEFVIYHGEFLKIGEGDWYREFNQQKDGLKVQGIKTDLGEILLTGRTTDFLIIAYDNGIPIANAWGRLLKTYTHVDRVFVLPTARGKKVAIAIIQYLLKTRRFLLWNAVHPAMDHVAVKFGGVQKTIEGYKGWALTLQDYPGNNDFDTSHLIVYHYCDKCKNKIQDNIDCPMCGKKFIQVSPISPIEKIFSLKNNSIATMKAPTTINLLNIPSKISFTQKGKWNVGSNPVEMIPYDLDHDGRAELIIATTDDYLRVLRIEINQWIELAKIRIPMSISTITVADLDTDEYPEIIIGSRDKMVRVYNLVGNELKIKGGYKYPDPIYYITTGDVFSKKQTNIIVCAGKYLSILSYTNGNLREEDNLRQNREVMCAAIRDFDNNGVNDLFFGGRDNEIQVIQYKSRFFQEQKARLHLDYYVKGLIIEDLNGDGIMEILLITADGKFGIYQYNRGAFKAIFYRENRALWNALAISTVYGPDKIIIFLGGTQKQVISNEYSKEGLKEGPSFSCDAVINTITTGAFTQDAANEIVVGCENGTLFLLVI